MACPWPMLRSRQRCRTARLLNPPWVETSMQQRIENSNLISMTIRSPVPETNRWSIAVAGVIIQIALGAVYAGSVFRMPLTKEFGWTISQVTFAFTLAILTLGFASFIGGLWMRRSGP